MDKKMHGRIVIIPVSNNTLSNNVSNPVIPRNNSSCLLDPVTGNGSCHNHGLVNYNTSLPCNRCNVTPLYVQEICQSKANGCSISYDKCVKKLTCTNSGCNPCN